MKKKTNTNLKKKSLNKKEKNDVNIKLIIALSSLLSISSLILLFKNLLDNENKKNTDFIKDFYKATRVSGKGKEIYEKIYGTSKDPQILKVKFPPNFGKEHLNLGVGYTGEKNTDIQKIVYPNDTQLQKLKKLKIKPKFFTK